MSPFALTGFHVTNQSASATDSGTSTRSSVRSSEGWKNLMPTGPAGDGRSSGRFPSVTRASAVPMFSPGLYDSASQGIRSPPSLALTSTMRGPDAVSITSVWVRALVTPMARWARVRTSTTSRRREGVSTSPTTWPTSTQYGGWSISFSAMTYGSTSPSTHQQSTEISCPAKNSSTTIPREEAETS